MGDILKVDGFRVGVATALCLFIWTGSLVAQGPPGERRSPPQPGDEGITGWQIRAAAQTNLWYHTLAVIAADQPGPLGLYSAAYARHIRDVKQERGLYPTRLDSLATELREDIGDARGVMETLHFIPLYFPSADPETMLAALRAVSKRNARDEALNSPEARFGGFYLAQVMEQGGDRGLLERLVDAAEHEWEVFFRDYWEESRPRLEQRVAEMQDVWDTFIAPQLSSYLERERLDAGLVMPSPALGPEGRIVEFEEFQRGDQVVAVQDPIDGQGVDEAVYAFLKELCFLIIDDRSLVAGRSLSDVELDDVRRRAAVRCGAMLLGFYAPTLSARYRRVFLDAVGGEESSTVEAFERVYYLDPEIVRRLQDQIRGR
ncbi:MAG: hypothetical protein PVH40_09950 [Gemmatimonadales bacterium]|jgi:hypothetical protein